MGAAKISVEARTSSGTRLVGPGSSCTARVGSEQLPEMPEGGQAGLTIVCSADGTRVTFETTLGDLRKWPDGTVRPADQSVYFRVEQSGKETCSAAFHPTPLSFSVDAASGAAAPPPSLVTSDFHRSYRVNLDTRTFSVGTPSGACERVEVDIAIDLQFEQTSADYHYKPDGPCLCGI